MSFPRPDGGERLDAFAGVYKLLYRRYYEIDWADTRDYCPADGCADLTACLTEEELILLKELVTLPLRCDYGPFDYLKIKQLYIKLFEVEN